MTIDFKSCERKWLALGLAVACLAVAARGQPHQAQVTVSAYGLIFIPCEGEGRKVLALVDTGSFRSIQISSSLANQLNLPLSETGEVMSRYSGQAPARESKLRRRAMSDSG